MLNNKILTKISNKNTIFGKISKQGMVPIFDEFKTLNDFKNLRIAFHGCISNNYKIIKYTVHEAWVFEAQEMDRNFFPNKLIDSFYTVFVNYGRLKEVVMEDHIGFE